MNNQLNLLFNEGVPLESDESAAEKLCNSCGGVKSVQEFYISSSKDGRMGRCKECHIQAMVLREARLRAERQGVPFRLTEGDVQIPESCPVLGIPLYRNEGSAGPNSPSIDRVIPNLGYVPENILVVSQMANQIKSSADPYEILMVGLFYYQVSQLSETNSFPEEETP